MSIWDEAELIEPAQTKKNIWAEAELVEPSKPKVSNLTGQNNTNYVGKQAKQLTPQQQAQIAQIKADYEAKNKEIDAQHRKELGRIAAGGLLQGASALPIFNIPYVGTGLGGAMFELGQGLMEGDKANDLLKRAGTGFAVGETVGAIPYVGKYVGKTKAGKAVGNAVAKSGVGKAVTNVANSVANSQIAKKTSEVLSKEVKLPSVAKPQPQVNMQVSGKIKTPNMSEAVETIVNSGGSVGRAVKPQTTGMLRETNPSKLQETMKKVGTLPEELQNKTIEYEVLHNPNTVAKAQEAIGTDAEAVHRDLLKKISGQGDYENYVLNANDVVKARELATKLYQEGNNKEAVELTEGIIKAASKTGQALQAYTLWARTTPEGAVTFAQKMLDRYNKSQHKKLKLSDAQIEDIKNLAQKVQETAEGTRENEVAIGLMQKYIADLTPVSWQKKYDTYRYINMLLSSKSRTKDFLLTGLNAADTAIDEAIANGIDKVRTLLPNQTQRVFSGLKPKEWISGLKKGFNEGVEDVALNINTSRSGEVGRYGLPKATSFKYTPLSGIEKNPKGLLQLGENILAGGEKGLNYTIQVPDRMFYEARYASSLADQMAAAGVKEPTQDMMNQAMKEALEAVYQDNSWVSRLGNGTRNLINGLAEVPEKQLNLPEGSIPRIGNFIAPFVTTPANIVNVGLKNTTGGVTGLAKLLGTRTPQEVRDAEMLMAKGIKGLMPLGIGAGIGTGAIESNIGADDYQSNAVTGLKPQSIVIGDKAFSLKDYPQWSIPMSVGAGLAQGGLPQALANTTQAIGDISALKAVGDIQKAFKPSYVGEDMTTAKVVNNLFRDQGVNILSQNIPFGGLLGEIRNDIDPYAREMYMPMGNTNQEMMQNSLQYAGNRLLNRLPFASTLLPMKYNAIGNPARINNIDNPIARVASETFDFGVRNYDDSPTYDQLNRFQNNIKDTNYVGKTRVGLHTPSRSIRVNGKNIKLNNEQYSEYSKDYTTINYVLKEKALYDPEFIDMNDEDKTKYLGDIRKSVEEAVKIMQFAHIPSRKYHPYTQYILDNYSELIK